MKIIIKADELNRYIWTIKVLSITVPEFKGLRQREIEVLSYLMMVYNRHSNLSEIEKNAIVFDKTTKKEICEHFNITMENLYNILVTLRKNNMIENEKIKTVVKLVKEINIVFT